MKKQVPHLRWSQAPPLPWPRQGSADYILLYYIILFYFILSHIIPSLPTACSGGVWALTCSAHLGAMLAHIFGAMLAHLEAYVGPSRGLSWPMLTHLKPQAPKNAKKMPRAQNTVKHRGFWPYRVGLRLGRRPFSPTERRETPSAMPRPGGPWPDLSAYARQPARGPNYVGPSCGYMLAYVGVCWPIFAGNVGPSCGYVGLCLPHVGPC